MEMLCFSIIHKFFANENELDVVNYIRENNKQTNNYNGKQSDIM